MNGPCKAYHASIADQVLGLLESAPSQALFEHIETCEACASYWQALQHDHDQLLEFGKHLENTLSERIEHCVTAVMQSDSQARQRVIPMRRNIKMNTLIKIAAAAAIAVGLSIWSLLPTRPGKLSPLTLLTAVHAAEDALFTGADTLYIRNEIRVYPSSTQKEGVWLPMCSLKSDGQFRFDQLTLAAEEEVYTVIDQAWYDSPTGRFVRLLQADDRIVFGNAYDGTNLYTAQWDANATLQVQQQSLGQQFTAPARPAEFFGLSAGMPSGLSEETLDLVTIETGTLADGSPVHSYRVGSPGLIDPNHTYWLFRVRDDDHTVAEKEFVMKDETRLLIRRVLSEPTDATGVHWDMSDLQGRQSSQIQPPKAAVNANMVQMDVSVQHMVEAAGFETYMPKQPPAGIDRLQIMDINVGGPQQRMFVMAGRAQDNRHVVLVQSMVFNRQTQARNLFTQGTLVCTADNGFQIWSGAPQAMAKTMLQSSMTILKDPPSPACTAYGLLSPTQTGIVLAVNGAMTEDELKQLADSLIPAKAYLQQPD